MTFTERGESGLALTIVNTSDLAEVIEAEPIEIELRAGPRGPLRRPAARQQSWTPAVFFSLADGSRYVHLGARATRRVEAELTVPDGGRCTGAQWSPTPTTTC